MKTSPHRYTGLASMLLLTAATFAACGGLDSRKVTRDPAGDGTGNEASGGADNPGPGSGGADARGGDMGNPFGGQLFEGGAPPVLDGPPTVLQVDPSDAAADAEPTSDISLLFSEGLDAATVTPASIKLLDGDVELTGDLTYAGVVATFEPARRLSLLASYDVSVSTAVTDSGGTALQEAFASRFTVRDGVWGAVTPAFEDYETSGGTQEIGMDGRGNALVIWTRYQQGASRVVARWYRATTGWQPEVTLDDGTLPASAPTVAVSPEGDAVVAWYGHDVLVGYQVFARRYINGAWEQAQQNVSGSSMYPFDYQGSLRAAIGAGRALVAWVRDDYVPQQPYLEYYHVHASVAAIDAAWPADAPPYFTATYTAPNYEHISGVSGILDASGNAVVAFGYRSDYVDPNPDYGAGVYYMRHAVAGNWQYPAKIPGSTMPSSGPYLATDGAGAMALWTTYSSVTQDYHILASRYTKAKQFVTGVDIGDPDLTEAISLSQGALVGNSNAFLAGWGQQVGSGYNAYVTRYDIATSMWDDVPSFVSDGTGNAYRVAPGLDDHGNALVAIEQDSGNVGSIVYTRRAAGGAWGAPQPLSPDDNSYDSPLLAVAGNGIAAMLYRGGGREGPTGQGNYVAGQFRFFD